MSKSPEFYALINTISKQANVDIPLADESPKTAVLRIFENGDAIKALTKHHARYSDEHGRIYPMYDDDEGFDDLQDSGVPTDDAVEAVAYAWETVEAARTFQSFATAYENLMSACSDLSSWHPQYL